MHSVAFQNDWIMPWREWMKPQQQCRLQTHIHCIRYTDAVKCSGKNIFIAPSNRYVYSALIHWAKPPYFRIALGCSAPISVKGHVLQSDCIKAHRCRGFPHPTTIFWSLWTTFGSFKSYEITHPSENLGPDLWLQPICAVPPTVSQFAATENSSRRLRMNICQMTLC